MGRLIHLRQRVLLPVGVAAVALGALGAVGDGLLGSTVLFAVGLVVAAVALVAMAATFYVEPAQGVSPVSRHQPHQGAQLPPSDAKQQVTVLEGGLWWRR